MQNSDLLKNKMNQPFDQIASNYDTSFTYSLVGKTQRNLVWNYLEKVLKNNSIKNILEINCGTGEDALWLAKKGLNIVATDISEKMIEIAHEKVKESLDLSFQVVDIHNINLVFSNSNFDLLFSNFGGLNCISPTEFIDLLNIKIPALLQKNGRIILVLMPRFCLNESLYFLGKLQFGKIFRRLSKKPLEANLSDEHSVKTWYYSSNFIKKNLSEKYEINNIVPIGFFIPPSYLNSFVEKRPNLFRILIKLEKAINKFSFLANLSDHYLIEIVHK